MHPVRVCVGSVDASFNELMDSIEANTDDADAAIIVRFEAAERFVTGVEKLALEKVRALEGRRKKPLVAYESGFGPLFRQSAIISSSVANRRNTRLSHALIHSISMSLPKDVPEFVEWPLWSVNRIPRELCLNYELSRYKDVISANLYPINRDVSTLDPDSETCGLAMRKPAAPYGLAVHPTRGDVYVTEQYSGTISIYTSGLEYKKSYTPTKESDPILRSPRGLCFSASGESLYVACSKNHYVAVFTDELVFVDYLKTTKDEVFKFSNPTCVAVDCDEFIYVTDQDAYKVMKFGPDFTFVKEGNLRPVLPDAITVDDQNRLLTFPRAGDTIYIICQEKMEISGGFQCSKALANWNYLCRGPNGGFCLSVYNNEVIHIFSKDGKVIQSIKVKHPIGTSFGLDGSLFVILAYPNDLIRI